MEQQEQQNENDDLLTRKEVCEFLKISLVTLHNHNKEGRLVPSHRIGRRPLYLRSDLMEQIKLKF